jgi:hypothetical protein
MQLARRVVPIVPYRPYQNNKNGRPQAAIFHLLGEVFRLRHTCIISVRNAPVR